MKTLLIFYINCIQIEYTYIICFKSHNLLRPMQPSAYNPKNYIKNKEKFQHYECGICFDISTNLVKCKGTCKKVFCIQCVSQTKNISDKCPNRCSKPFYATKLPSPQFQFYCPYNTLCRVSITSIEEFHDHFQVCSFAPQQQKAKKRLKEQYRCFKQHNLQFFVGQYNEMVSSICAQCQQPKLCRSICRKCDQKYCIQCRMPPCSKSHCPIGHQFNLFKDPNLQYICDVCGMNGSIFNTGIYDDKVCNFGICENCMQKLPQKRDNKHLKKLVNNQQKCGCGSDLVYVSKQKSNCSLCERWKNCPKYCPSCNLNFCLKCKNVGIYEDICEYQHLFQMLAAGDYQGDGCMRCEKAGPFYYNDKNCGITLCHQCKDYFHSITNDKLRLKTVYCDEGHKLAIKKCGEGVCKKCKQNKRIELICLQCQTKQIEYCFQCKPIPFNTCYFQHPLKSNSPENQQKRSCSMCELQHNQYKCCRKCKFYVCQNCCQASIDPSQISQALQMLLIS